MARSKSKKLPKFDSLEKLVEFFDANDLGDYLDDMPVVEFDVDIKRRTHLIAIDENLAAKVSEVAKSKKVSSEKLIISWIKEGLSKAS